MKQIIKLKLILLCLLSLKILAVDLPGGGAAANPEPEIRGHLGEDAPAETWLIERSRRLAMRFTVPKGLEDGFTLEEVNEARVTQDFERRCPEAFAIFQDFSARGAHVHYIAEDFDLEAKGSFPMVFPLNSKTDIVLPVCHSGVNRSQVLGLVVRDLSPKMKVLAPHGAFDGFDPYRAFIDLNRDNFFGYINGVTDESDYLSQQFLGTFGLPKQLRSGTLIHEKLGKPFLNPQRQTPRVFRQLAKNPTAMRQAMDKDFWVKTATLAGTRRKIFVCFGNSATTVISRLIESIESHIEKFVDEMLANEKPEVKELLKQNQLNSVFKKLHVIVLPWPDPVTNSSSKENLRRTGLEDNQENKDFLTKTCYQQMYTQYSKLFCLAS